MFRRMLRLHNAREIVQVAANGEAFLSGDAARNIALLTAAPSTGLSLVVNQEGIIEAIGNDEEISKRFEECLFDNVIDVEQGCLLPGFVDAHTHPIWAGDRVHEFSLKLSGASYLDIHAAGGGIHFTVEKTKQASDAELMTTLEYRMDNMLKAGSTTVEVKTGYGLELKEELRLLRILQSVCEKHPIEMVITYCGAHAIPKGVSSEQAKNDILNRHIPAIKELRDSGKVNIENFDIFCEKKVFELDASREILTAAKKSGFALNFHAEELSYLGSVEMGTEVGVRAMSHLEHISAQGIVGMGESKCVAVVLPTTAFTLRIQPPPVRDLIKNNVPVALGSDFNPNAHCCAMPLVMYLGCITCNLSLEESISAATINAAFSLHRSHSIGSLEIGKKADIVVIDASKWEHIIYQFGSHQDLIRYVIKNGRIVHSRV